MADDRALVMVCFGALVSGWFVAVAFPSDDIRDLRVVTSDEGQDALFVSELVRHRTTRLDSTGHVILAHASQVALILVVGGELMAFGLDRGEERYRVSL